MKSCLVVALLVLAANALPFEETHVNGENGWFVPQADGTVEWMSTKQAEAALTALKQKEGRALFSNIVRFYLYTKSNPEKAIEITPSKESIDASPFNPANPIRFTIHGWTCNYEDEGNLWMNQAWLTQGDYNIIAVDWERARSKDYISSVIAIPDVGKQIADMIDFIHENYNLPLDNFVVVGHSLGAHVAGFTGKNIKNGQVHSIVGLDPALPLFNYDKPNERLASTDAVYVETIQTCGGKLGFLRPIGVASFYPNGGKYQPGCGVDLEGFCSHRRSLTYYAESIEKNDFPTKKCANYEDAVKNLCASSYSSVLMTAASNFRKVTGQFYVPVHDEAPWGLAA